MTKHNQIPETFLQNDGVKIADKAEELSRQAADAISGLTEQYLVQSKEDLVIMKKLLVRARTAPDAKRFNLIRDKYFLKVHDMKGQGSTFGYPLLTEVGAYACDYLRHKTEITDADLDLLDKLTLDVERILKEDLTGMGGMAGSEIRSHLGPKPE